MLPDAQLRAYKPDWTGSGRNNMYKSTTNSKISGNFVHMKQEIPENIQKVLDENNGTISSSHGKTGAA